MLRATGIPLDPADPQVIRLNIDRDRTVKELKNHRRWTGVQAGYVLGPVYFAEFLTFANRRCDRAVLSVMTRYRRDPGVVEALSALGEPLAESTGRQTLTTIGPEATLYEYRFDRALITRFLAICDDLRQWQNPDLPEDLVLLRPDRTAFFVSCVHEEDALVKLTAQELAEVTQQQAPWLACRIGSA